MLRLNPFAQLYLILFFLLPVYSHGQISNFNLSWNDMKSSYKIESKAIQIPSFQGAIHVPSKNNVPIFTTEIHLSQF
jgi:hypothetical protein